ncbi:hypothetical protein EVAR_93711_1 [Eumeta japonica]|uniref:Uncharacterized protein n=1 Tax=Eumeta variegata TaxID=151549 RepID=A0A4C1U3B4_EUMVA|nr:hypothetical protein EVAR_93711_1 [Eumeta japonica]
MESKVKFTIRGVATAVSAVSMIRGPGLQRPLTYVTKASTKQLRRLWMNMKQRQRDALIKERLLRMAADRGPSTSVKIDPDIAILTPELIVSVDNGIDSDTTSESLVDNSLSSAVKTPKCSTLADDSIVNDTNINERPLANSTASTSYSLPYTSQTHCALSTCQAHIIPTTSLIHPISCTSKVNSVPTTSQTILIPTQAVPISAAQDNELEFVVRRRRSIDTQKCMILHKQFKGRSKRLNEIHQLETELLREKIREAKAKADLAELLLQHARAMQSRVPCRTLHAGVPRSMPRTCYGLEFCFALGLFI